MMTTKESTVWITVRILTLLESTGVSVGPKAELVVKATKKVVKEARSPADRPLAVLLLHLRE